MPLGVKSFGAEGRVAVIPQRVSRARLVGVGKEVPEPRLGEVRFDPGTLSLARPVRAFGKPAADGRDAEETAMLVLAYGELQPDAFVPPQQRQVSVRGGRPDDLQHTALLQAPERG